VANLYRVGVKPTGFHQRVSAIYVAFPLSRLTLARPKSTPTMSGILEMTKREFLRGFAAVDADLADNSRSARCKHSEIGRSR